MQKRRNRKMRRMEMLLCEKIAAAHCNCESSRINRFYGEWENGYGARYFLEHDAATAKTVRKIRIGSMG